MEIIAHRGASHDAPENTLAAVQLAWQQHADAVEVDVRISRDGQLVVIHDDNTRRTGKAARKVSDETLFVGHALQGRRKVGFRKFFQQRAGAANGFFDLPEGVATMA